MFLKISKLYKNALFANRAFLCNLLWRIILKPNVHDYRLKVTIYDFSLVESITKGLQAGGSLLKASGFAVTSSAS